MFQRATNHPRPPTDLYCDDSAFTASLVKQFADLVENNSGEKVIDGFLRMHPSILTVALKWVYSGHQGSWVLTQQPISVKVTKSERGLIPDYIIGGKNSDGFQWFVVELKGASDTLFSERGELRFSSVLNEGISQISLYIDYCSRNQSFFRDEFGLTNFEKPKGILLIGREKELDRDSNKRRIKREFNNSNITIQIRTYDALLRNLQSILEFREKRKVNLALNTW